MSHASLRDLTEAVHGFVDLPSHVHDCPDCGGRRKEIERELDLLRRAEARVAPPAASSRGWRRLPVALAAGLTLALLTWILARPGAPPAVPAQEDVVARFLEGSPEESERAHRELLAQGPAALPKVVEARRKKPDARRADALSALIFELKRRESGDRGKAVYEKLDQIRITVDMQNAPLTAVMDYLAEITELPVSIDPRLSVEEVDLKVADTSGRHTLDLLTRLTNAEWGFRWGRLYLAPAERLWGPAALPLANRWRAQEVGAAGQATVRALQTLKMDLAFENTPIADILGFVRDFSKLNIVLEKIGDPEPVTFKGRNAVLGEVLEMITLPQGLDARIEEGTLVIYPRK
jgi:hypothetical protein